MSAFPGRVQIMHVVEITNYINTDRRTESTPILYYQVSYRVVLHSGVHRNFVLGGRGSTNSVEDRGQRERGSGAGNPLVRGSGGSCNLVQEFSFHIVKFS